jgi:hypothetical protein
MGEAKRRKLDGETQQFVNIEHAVTQFADSVLHGGRDTPTIAVGPVVWNIEAGHDRKHWYFMEAPMPPASSVPINSRSPTTISHWPKKPAQPWCWHSSTDATRSSMTS